MPSSQQKQQHQQQKKVRGRRHRLAIRMDPELKRNLVPFHVRALGVAQRSMGSPLVYEAQVLRPDVENTMTDLETFLNLVKCAFGTGCLAMPRAFYNAGWLIGLLATVLIGFIVVYAMHVLLNDIQHLCRRHRMAVLSYRETMELALLDGPTWLHCMSRPLGFVQSGPHYIPSVFIPILQLLRGHSDVCLSFRCGLCLHCVYSQEPKILGGSVSLSHGSASVYGPADPPTDTHVPREESEVSVAVYCHLQYPDCRQFWHHFLVSCAGFAQLGGTAGHTALDAVPSLLWHCSVCHRISRCYFSSAAQHAASRELSGLLRGPQSGHGPRGPLLCSVWVLWLLAIREGHGQLHSAQPAAPRNPATVRDGNVCDGHVLQLRLAGLRHRGHHLAGIHAAQAGGECCLRAIRGVSGAPCPRDCLCAGGHWLSGLWAAPLLCGILLPGTIGAHLSGNRQHVCAVQPGLWLWQDPALAVPLLPRVGPLGGDLWYSDLGEGIE
ncbi:uncharacterized protein [Drosophila pseudoobscura]|uniref:Uncharacterized protein isoform X1 n=1 Tax=Drosophila pseudoobscura pseudoobscura TaxID=46245 RepID=A0A6I8WDF7_DROPS|nr:uncharacterized protein LOC4813664 isoform X1 [Drosophila pseudoobscura]